MKTMRLASAPAPHRSDILRMPSSSHPHRLGHVVETNQATVFFGNRHSGEEDLATLFPDFKFISVKQTHSDIVVISPPSGANPEADAHITKVKKVALTIRTADCLPVLIHDSDSGWIAAIHAGWRGIENEIIRKTCAKLAEAGAVLSQAHAWIGPHIARDSFEVGQDVAAKLEARFDAVRGFSSLSTSLAQHRDSVKAYVDLVAIAEAQLAAAGIEAERVTGLPIDTLTSKDHASFRRDGPRAGRQVSFIALK